MFINTKDFSSLRSTVKGMQRQGKLGENLLANHLSGKGVAFRVEHSHSVIHKKTVQWNIHTWFKQCFTRWCVCIHTYIYMVNEYMKRCSTLLLLEKCRGKPQWDAILYLLECIKLKRLFVPSIGEEVEQPAISYTYTTGRNGNGKTTVE